MSNKQPEALRLADACDSAADVADMGRPEIYNDWRRMSAAELRRLHAANVALTEALQSAVDLADENRAKAERDGGPPVRRTPRMQAVYQACVDAISQHGAQQ